MHDFILFPAIDPALIRFEILGFELALRWYALAYIAGLLLGWQLVKGLMRRPGLWPADRAPMVPEATDDLLTAMILGVVIGGRLGYVLFYEPSAFLADPIKILRIWDGGMSFHGGFLGVILGVILYSRRVNAPVIQVGDAVALAAPIGIFFGRVANFVNAELWGRPTTQPWGVIFPSERAQTCPAWWEGVCARHPSQLYEAALEGALLFVILLVGLRRGWLKRPGTMIGVFLIGYGLGRSVAEFFRQPDAQFAHAGNPIGFAIQFGEWGLTMGQILSLPMIVLGLVIVLRAAKRGRA